MPGSNSSSTGSKHSLRSKGPVQEVDECDALTISHRKLPAKWTEEEDAVLVAYLRLHISGDGTNFKKTIWKGAADHLKEKFPQPQQGGEKTQSSCQTRWSKLKKLYHAVLDIKNASGFTWSDEDGAGITLAYESTWETFLKSHKDARSFKNKGFPLFDAIHQMLPRKSKGTFVHRNGPYRSAGTAPATVAATLPEASTLPPPLQPLTALNLSQLTVATNEIISEAPSESHLPSASGLPGSGSQFMEIPPTSSPAPSTFLTTPSQTSRQEKRKVSALGSDHDMAVSTATSKRSRPISASVQVQQEGNRAIIQLSDVMEDMRQTFARSSARAAQEDYGRAIAMISRCATLSSDEKMDMMDYLGQDEKHVTKYLNMDDSLRSVWVQRQLANIRTSTRAALGGSPA